MMDQIRSFKFIVNLYTGSVLTKKSRKRLLN